MVQRILVSKDVTLSRLIFGTWRLLSRVETRSPEGIARLIALCLEHGVSSIDLADIYGDYQIEELVGRALQSVDRSRVELITKCGILLPSAQRPEIRRKVYDSSPRHIRWSVEQSLRNLRVDYLDMLLLHRPDVLMDADGVVAIAQELMAEGKIRSFGVSNFSRSQCDLLLARAPGLLAANQIEAHLLHLQAFFDGTLDHAQQHRYRPMIWSPLAGGRLWTERSSTAIALQNVLRAFASKYGCTEEAIALAWLLQHPSGPLPVLGSLDSQRLVTLFSSDSIDLEREDWYQLLTAAWGRDLP